MAAIVVVIPALVLAVAVETLAALVVYGGGGPPLPCPVVGMVHVARVWPGVHAGADETVSVSLPELPVSVFVLTKRFSVVLG